MELPSLLKFNLCTKTDDYKICDLKLALSNITTRYIDDSRSGNPLLTKDIEACAYANVRMAATFAANTSALKYALEYIDDYPRTLLDVGAGTGSATWACNELINLDKCTLLEAEDAMINLGKILMKDSDINCEWKKLNLKDDKITEKADLVFASYMINELSSEIFDDVINEMWNATNKYLIIVEPGTMMGFNNIKKVRKLLLEKGAHIVAPCPCDNCIIAEDDWCHFTSRVSRSKIHKLLKEGDAPYEDEKFSYIVLSKVETKKCDMRIMRHPIIETGKVEITACTKEGIKNIVYHKKDDEFKKAKKSSSGDAI